MTPLKRWRAALARFLVEGAQYMGPMWVGPVWVALPPEESVHREAGPEDGAGHLEYNAGHLDYYDPQVWERPGDR